MKDEVRKYGTGMHISITQTVFVNTDLIFFCLKGHFKCKTLTNKQNKISMKKNNP